MRSGTTIAAAVAVTLTVAGCRSTPIGTNSNSGSAQPVTWSGPDAGVSSGDAPHCGKSRLAERYDLPGFITVTRAGMSIPYHSTDEQAPLTSSVFSGYSLGRLDLYFTPARSREVLVRVGQQETTVVYDEGGCA